VSSAALETQEVAPKSQDLAPETGTEAEVVTTLRSLSDIYRETTLEGAAQALERLRDHAAAALESDPVGSLRKAFQVGIALTGIRREHLNSMAVGLATKVLHDAVAKLESR
jgi:hypothetical protein